MPDVNLMSVDVVSDRFWKPRVERTLRKTMKAHYVDETLFVHGTYSPGHFSHWLYNTMLPLHRYGNSWEKRRGASVTYLLIDISQIMLIDAMLFHL